MKRIIRIGDDGVEGAGSLDRVDLDDLTAKPTAPEAGKVALYSRGGALYRQAADGTEMLLEGGGPATYRKTTVSVSRLCPAFWNNAGIPVYSEGRIRACTWPTEKYLYVIGGCSDDWTVQDTVLRASWDDMTSWEVVGHLPEVRADAVLLADAAGNLYLLGGYNASWATVNSIFRSIGGDLSKWEAVSGASTPSAITRAISYKGKRYLVGGYDDNYAFSMVWEADAEDLTTWTVVSYLPYDINQQVMVIIDDRLYVIGGVLNGSMSMRVYSAAMSNIAVWTDHGDCLYQAVARSNLLVLGEKVYLLGGVDENWNAVSTIQSVSLAEIGGGQWQAESDILDYSCGELIFAIDRARGRLWRVGGEIYSSAINMLWTDLAVDSIEVTSKPSIQAVYEYPERVTYQARELIATDILSCAEFGGVYFGGAGASRSGIERRAGDGALIIKDDSRRLSAKIATEEDQRRVWFYAMEDI